MVENKTLSRYESYHMSHRVYIVITVCWTIKNKIHPLNTLEESLKSARDKHRHWALRFPDQSDGDDDTPGLDVPGHSERVGWFKLCWNRNLINFRKKRAARRRRHSMYKMTKLGRLQGCSKNMAENKTFGSDIKSTTFHWVQGLI